MRTSASQMFLALFAISTESSRLISSSSKADTNTVTANSSQESVSSIDLEFKLLIGLSVFTNSLIVFSFSTLNNSLLFAPILNTSVISNKNHRCNISYFTTFYLGKRN